MLQERCAVFQRGPTSTSECGQGCPAGRILAPPPGSGRCQRPWTRASPSPPCRGTWAREPGSSAAGSKAPGRARRCPSSRGPAWRQPRSPPEGHLVTKSVVIFFLLQFLSEDECCHLEEAPFWIVAFVSCCCLNWKATCKFHNCSWLTISAGKSSAFFCCFFCQKTNLFYSLLK